jgi:hypothetical protein
MSVADIIDLERIAGALLAHSDRSNFWRRAGGQAHQQWVRSTIVQLAEAAAHC